MVTLRFHRRMWRHERQPLGAPPDQRRVRVVLAGPQRSPTQAAGQPAGLPPTDLLHGHDVGGAAGDHGSHVVEVRSRDPRMFQSTLARWSTGSPVWPGALPSGAMSRLAGKVALITGASSGLGRVGAERFAAEGAKVVIADMADGDEVVEAIAAAGGEATYVSLRRHRRAVDRGGRAARRRDLRWAARAVQQRRRDAGRRRQPGHHQHRDVPEDDGHQRARRAARLQVRDPGDARASAKQCGEASSIVNVASFVAHMGAATPQIAYTASRARCWR